MIFYGWLPTDRLKITPPSIMAVWYLLFPGSKYNSVAHHLSALPRKVAWANVLGGAQFKILRSIWPLGWTTSKVILILQVIVMIAYLARDSHGHDNQRWSGRFCPFTNDLKIDKISGMIRMKPNEDEFPNARCEQLSIVAAFASDGCKSDSFHSSNSILPPRRNHINLHSLFFIVLLLCLMALSKYWGCPSHDLIPLLISGFPNRLSQWLFRSALDFIWSKFAMSTNWPETIFTLITSINCDSSQCRNSWLRMICILEFNRRRGRGVRIDEDFAEVAKSEDEHAEHGG
jgi:hypothetical protein